MSEAPERIWWNVAPLPYSYTSTVQFAGGVEYVRADRIEELEAENIKLREAVYIDDLTVTMLVNDKKKALGGVGRALDFLNADMHNEAKTALRTTLAEITGGKDE